MAATHMSGLVMQLMLLRVISFSYGGRTAMIFYYTMLRFAINFAFQTSLGQAVIAIRWPTIVEP